MVKVKDIYEFLNQIAPFETAMNFDNCGLLVGDFKEEVKKVLISLDITNDVCEEAKKIGANLILSHHPIIFHPLKSISFKSPVSNLIKNEINAICAHTNLDMAKEGVNFFLAKTLGLLDLEALTFENSSPLGFVGNLKNEMKDKEFAKFVKESLSCEGIRYTSNKKKIKKVAVCSGSGGSFINEAAQKGADAFVIGEIKHSDILKANEIGIQIVDTGHFRSENVIVEPLKSKLENKFKEIEFFTSKVFTDKIKYL